MTEKKIKYVLFYISYEAVCFLTLFNELWFSRYSKMQPISHMRIRCTFMECYIQFKYGKKLL